MNQQTADSDGLAHLAWTFGDGWTAGETGPVMSCMEADALTAVLARAHYIDEAVVWLRGHARADSEMQDHHWGLPDEVLRDYVLMLAGETSIVDVLGRALTVMSSDQERELRETFPKITSKLDEVSAGQIRPGALAGALQLASGSWSDAEDAMEEVLR